MEVYVDAESDPGNSRMPKSFCCICQCLSTESRRSFMNDCSDWDRIAKIRPISDSGPRMKVAQITIEKMRFHVICAVDTVMRKADLSHECPFCLQSECSHTFKYVPSEFTLLSLLALPCWYDQALKLRGREETVYFLFCFHCLNPVAVPRALPHILLQLRQRW